MPQGEVRGGVEHGEGGKFLDKYSDDEVLDVLVGAHPEPLTNKEVAQRIGCSKATAHNRLHELAAEDRVFTKEAGARARVWWVEPSEVERNDPAGVYSEIDHLERPELMDLAAWFRPDFNPTRTATEDIRQFCREQNYPVLEHAISEVLHGEGDEGDGA